MSDTTSPADAFAEAVAHLAEIEAETPETDEEEGNHRAQLDRAQAEVEEARSAFMRTVNGKEIVVTAHFADSADLDAHTAALDSIKADGTETSVVAYAVDPDATMGEALAALTMEVIEETAANPRTGLGKHLIVTAHFTDATDLDRVAAVLGPLKTQGTQGSTAFYDISENPLIQQGLAELALHELAAGLAREA